MIQKLFCLLWAMLVLNTSIQVQKPASLIVRRWTGAYITASLHIWKHTINAESQVLEDMCSHPHDVFPYFTSTTINLHLLHQSGFTAVEYRGLNSPDCSPDLSSIWCIMKQKIWLSKPIIFEPLESSIWQIWDDIPVPKVHQLVSSVPRHLRTAVKRRGDSTCSKHGTVPTCCWHQMWNTFSIAGLWDLQISCRHAYFYI